MRTSDPATKRSGACEHRSRVRLRPVDAEPVAAPVPQPNTKREETDVEAAVGVAVASPPEEDGLPLPRLRYELRMLEEKVKPVVREDRLGLDDLAQLVAAHDPAILLLLGEVQTDGIRREDLMPEVAVPLDFPPSLSPLSWHRGDTTVDDMELRHHNLDFGAELEKLPELATGALPIANDPVLDLEPFGI